MIKPTLFLIFALVFGSVSSIGRALVPTNRYVRTDGSNTNCSGLIDAADPGSGATPRACALATPQYAQDNSSCGDTIFLKATHTWTTASGSTPVLTITKACSSGSPLTIKSTLADTIAQARPATLIPSAGTLAKFANLLSTGGSGGGVGPILIQSPAAYVVLDGLHLTTTGAGDNSTNALISAESGNHITIQRSYLHPPETSTSDWERSVERGVAVGADDVTFRWNSAGPFVGYYPGTGTPGQLITSEVIQCVVCNRLSVVENQMNAHYANIFLGGGDTGPGHTATISSITGTTGATLSSTTHLAAGIVLRISVIGTGTLVSDTLTRTSGSALTSGAINDGVTLTVSGGGTSYYNGILTSVAGDVYGVTTPQDPPNGTYDYALFQTVIINTVNSGTGAVTWTPYGVNALSQAPVGPGQVAWADGDEGLVNDVLVQRNMIEADNTFSSYHVSHGGNGPKGYWEVKNVNRMTVEGNEFIGFPSSPVWFGTNQAGTAPWITVKNIILRNNFTHPTPYGTGVLGPYMAFVALQGDTYTSTPGGNVEIYNNLALNQGMMMRLSDGSNVSLYHNTVLPDNDGVDFNTSLVTMNVTGGAVIVRDNIASFRGGALKCLIDGNLATCWPGTRTILNNLFVDEQSVGITTGWYNANSILGPVADDFTDVGFVNLTTCLTGTIASCALSGVSNYENAATDGTDPGVNVVTLAAALAPGGPVTSTAPTSTRGRINVRGRVTLKP